MGEAVFQASPIPLLAFQPPTVASPARPAHWLWWQ
ncbi:hypothetical protein BACUNI_00535 [Bacteroides uniformis ATCC 8492]|uniref:Uncharacterized protein n=1 Tax=Bacteroides uniformis (strain ATCC 8492 / DSM 6597 / CCUG 4942 / CIP 103695 / JCM 5828 / KCTC 5204 / NCTC 13054 / VPI 0061) TaxID=411479 RepID=A0ABC9NGQ9_BACUC|nr:hypothetical protein BACUNI_00535 [Bacteroides uniformis ATCC 8492]